MRKSMKGREWIVEGYTAFRADVFPKKRETFEELAQGQHPDVLIIGCSDSRADPAIIFNADPGDLFVVRNVANIVPPFAPDDAHHGTGAAIEFAVKALKVKTIIIMGHAKCGGVAAYISSGEPVEHDRFIGNWVECLALVDKPKGPINDEYYTAYEKAAVLQSMENLRQYDFVAEAIKSGQTELVGAYFQIDKALLFVADEGGVFEEVVTD